jgi:hypothetical protein
VRAGSRDNRRGFIQDNCILIRLELSRCHNQRHGASSCIRPIGERRKRGRVFWALSMMTRTANELLGQPVEDWFAAFVLELLGS